MEHRIICWWSGGITSAEALVILAEECSEVIQAVSKILRFGEDKEKIEKLTEEIGDLHTMLEIVVDLYHIVDCEEVKKAMKQKYLKLGKHSNLLL